MSKKVINIRVWDVPVEKLCQKHLCAQWREGLAIWSILNNPNSKSPYLNHPEVKRWKGKENIPKLYFKLYLTRQEMLKRNYHPKELPSNNFTIYDATCGIEEPIRWQSVEQQIMILKAKGCKCKVN